VELRVDQFGRTDAEYVEDLAHRVRDSGLKLILTVRIPQEGGREVRNREEIFRRVAPLSDFTDVELRERASGIPKIAVRANSMEDVARLLCIGHQEKYDKILIAMGEVGKISRIAGFVFGSVITYASLDESLAPGQIPLEETVKLRELFYK